MPKKKQVIEQPKGFDPMLKVALGFVVCFSLFMGLVFLWMSHQYHHEAWYVVTQKVEKNSEGIVLTASDGGRTPPLPYEYAKDVKVGDGVLIWAKVSGMGKVTIVSVEEYYDAESP